MLPIHYFHVVFTLPDMLNPPVLRNQKVVYDLLFRSAAESLLELSGDPRHLGADVGFLSILHTGGKTLWIILICIALSPAAASPGVEFPLLPLHIHSVSLR